MKTTDRQLRISYLTGEYPAVSHTFILREVIALRERGLDVETCSIRQTSTEHHRGPDERAAAASTWYLLAEARKPLRLMKAQARCFTNPKRYFSAMRLARRSCGPGWRAAIYQLFYFVEATVLADHIEARGITHLHNHFAMASGTVSMLAAQMTGVPFSFTLHGPSDFEDPGRWPLRDKIAQADFVCCISHFARSQAMLRSDPADWDKLRIIHCGVQPDRYGAANDTLLTGKRLVFIGRLAAVKGLRVLLEALKQTREKDPDVTLTLVGDGPDRKALEQEAKPLGEAVRFLGYQSQAEVAEILARSDILVLPSFAEGVPVVLMEAMASGKPVIATRVAGVSELVEDGVSGKLVAPGDVAGLNDAILALTASDAPRTDIGRAGRAKVEAEFDIDLEAERLASLFAGTAGPDPRP